MADRPEITVRVMPVAFSPKQFEAAFGIGHTKLYEEIKAGRLIARKLGKRTLILAQDAEAWACALPRAGRG